MEDSMNKQPEITDATRDAFITAFFKLAQIKNIYKITIKEITNLAGYNRTTFYRYFEDVFALIEYAEDEFIHDMLQSILPALGSNNELNEDFFKIYLSKFKEHEDRLTILLCDQNRASFIRRVENQTIKYMNSPIADTPRNKIIMDIYFTGIFSAMDEHLQHPDVISDDELLAIIRSLFTDWYWPSISN
jgi:AcrR family transcriptional regulator